MSRGILVPRRTGLTPATILVVDNNPEVLKVVKKMLARCSCDVLMADDGERALKMLEGHPQLDLVLSEAALPGLTGVDLVHNVAQSHPATRVMLMTGDADVQLDAAVPFIAKPFTFRDLIGRVEQVLAQSRDIRAKLEAECARGRDLAADSRRLMHESQAARAEARQNVEQSRQRRGGS